MQNLNSNLAVAVIASFFISFHSYLCVRSMQRRIGEDNFNQKEKNYNFSTKKFNSLVLHNNIVYQF